VKAWPTWLRLTAFVLLAVIGLGGAYGAFAFDAPKPILAISGVLFVAGAAAALIVGCWVYIVVIEQVRPAFRFRRPVVRMALSHDEAGLIGERRFRQHGIRFWGGMTLNNRFFVGFMLFDPPEHLTLAPPSPALNEELSDG